MGMLGGPIVASLLQEDSSLVGFDESTCISLHELNDKGLLHDSLDGLEC